MELDTQCIGTMCIIFDYDYLGVGFIVRLLRRNISGLKLEKELFFLLRSLFRLVGIYQPVFWIELLCLALGSSSLSGRWCSLQFLTYFGRKNGMGYNTRLGALYPVCPCKVAIFLEKVFIGP